MYSEQSNHHLLYYDTMDIIYTLMFLTWQLLAKWLTYMIRHHVFLPLCNITFKLDDTCLFTWFVEWSRLIMSKFVCHISSQMSNAITHFLCHFLFNGHNILSQNLFSTFAIKCQVHLLIYFALMAWSKQFVQTPLAIFKSKL